MIVAAGLITLALVAALAGWLSADGNRHQASATTTSSATSTSSSPTSSTSPPADTTARIVQLLDPAVVDIDTINQTDTGYDIAAATGMIVSSDGYIVTNNHVVEEATSIRVTIEGHQSQYRARFVGADPGADVAVIKVSGLAGLPTVHFGTSPIAPGEGVVALGNAHGRGGLPAVTTGEVSALDQSITASDAITPQPEHLTGMIKTNASITAGNSGGPLVDDHAAVIGMNTAATASSGYSYAVPIDRVADIAGAIESGRGGGGILLGLRAFLGVVGRPPKSGTTPDGVTVTRIIAGDPGAEAGIEPGDVIVDFDNTATPSVYVLQRLVLAREPGDVVTVTFESPNGQETSTVSLIDGPAP